MCPDPEQEGKDLKNLRKDENDDRELDEDYDTYQDLMFVDPRCYRLGMRIIMQKDGLLF